MKNIIVGFLMSYDYDKLRHSIPPSHWVFIWQPTCPSHARSKCVISRIYAQKSENIDIDKRYVGA